VDRQAPFQLVTTYLAGLVQAIGLGEFDAQTYNADIFVQRLKEWMEKRLMHFHVVDEIPNRDRFLHRVLTRCLG
jgi:hypothetical protein